MRALFLPIACCATLAACGGSSKPPPAKPQPPVAVTIDQPGDTSTVESGSVEVRGTVQPSAAQVRVLGRPATVSGGAFSVEVPLDPGANVVDVIATAPRRAPLMTAFRVTREILVTVPDLSGKGADDAQSALDSLGLKLDAKRGSDGFIDALLPGSPKVCTQKPEPGTRVHKGTTVSVVAAKGC
jgi:glucodextranase-like protein/PASTA domain-containing protein